MDLTPPPNHFTAEGPSPLDVPAPNERPSSTVGIVPSAESPGPGNQDCPTVPEKPARAKSAAPAATIGKYEILEKVAHGGMGIVYKARDAAVGRIVALKLLRAGDLARPDEVERFLREAHAAGQLQHPNIVPIFEVGRDGDRHFFTMPFVAGGSLGQHFQRQAADPKRAIALIEKIARAVQYAHDKGILHRDLKPGNVLLGENDEPMVSDFGLAKLLDASVDLTHSGQVLGTPAYMAPEQVAGQTGKIGPKADVWALGVMLYELVTGRRPFQGESREDLYRQILTTDPPSPRTVKTDLDGKLEAILNKCLEKDPSRRYSAGGLADDLNRWLHGQPVSVRPPSWPRRLARTLRRRPRTLVGGLLCVLGAAAVLFAMSPSPQDKLQRRLSQGKPVTLVGATGAPAYFRWCSGADAGQASADANGVFSIHSWTMSLLELLPDVPCDRYRIRAEVRHDRSDPHGEVGFYFGHTDHAVERGVLRCFCQLTFNDVNDMAGLAPLPPPVPPSNRAFLCLHLFEEPERGYDTRAAVVTSDGFTPSAAPNKPWRKLKVTVGPDRLDASLDNKPLRASLTRDEMVQSIHNLAGQLPLDRKGIDRLQSKLGPRGGLGLYILQGSASFRRVVVEPLDKE
jgi:serine/threonine-protein kinase